MSIVIGTGVSTKLDSFIAGKEAAATAYYQLSEEKSDIVIAFISTIFDQQETIRGIRSVTKETPLVGCSSIGTISTSGSFKNSVSVSIISSDSIRFSRGIGSDINKNSRFAGRKAATDASNLIPDAKKQAYIILSDCLSGNKIDLLRGTQEVLGTSFPIIGGLATDNLGFQKTYQYLDNFVYTNAIVGLLISGGIGVGIGKAIGWQPIGKPHTVTKANANIIKEIDKKPAGRLYEEYFEKTFDELKMNGIARLGISYPLGVQGAGANKEYIVRLPLNLEDNGSLVMNAEIREGQDVNLMIGDSFSILTSTKEACSEAIKYIKNRKIKFAVVFSDIARLKLLEKDSYKEVEIIKDTIGKNVPIIGCYTCGEYAPFAIYESKGQSYFNNQAISITIFSE